MDAADHASPNHPEVMSPENPDSTLATSGIDVPVLIEPDLEFKRSMGRHVGIVFGKCFQCGTCSATCEISPDHEPFPRKEMVWAAWGMKDRLMQDPDVWLCYQCNDCSTRCPRGGRPGEVLAAVRKECISHFSFPRFLGRWLTQPQSVPLLLGIPIVLLTLVLYLVGPVEKALDLTRDTGDRIVIAYSSLFPHWALNTFFAFIGLLVLIVLIIGLIRFWRAMKKTIIPGRFAAGRKSLGRSILTTLRKIFMHSDFTLCLKSRPRFASHLCVFFGFLALSVVTIWVITARINPLINESFIYPFGFWSPWKILANLGGAALSIGLLLMIRDRMRNDDRIGRGTYFDWVLITQLLLVAITGFATEILHFLRLEPHRHIIYFMHLVFALSLIMYLPYSKLAHLVYRAVAMVFAEYTGRMEEIPRGETFKPEEKEERLEEQVEKSPA